MSGPIHLGPPALGFAAVLILVNGVISLWLGLGLGRRLLVAAARTIVQLLLLGYVLVPVFAWERPAPVLLMAVAMVLLAGRAAIRRTARTYRGVFLHAVTALAVSATVTAVVGTALVIGVEPWWAPRYFIPMAGMILGNALTGISLGLDRALSLLDEGRDQVEALLALGASRWEATRPVAAEAVRTGMIPILNTMSVVGLVTIPGMMTGQILGGTPPAEAARYQIVIIFLIAAATALGAVISVLFGVRAVFDEQHRLRPERLRGRSGGA